MMGHTFKSGYSSPLKKVSVMALYEELKRRGFKVTELKEDYSIKIPKKEVDI